MRTKIFLAWVICLTLLIVINCQPFKKLNKRLDTIEGKMDQFHQEEMSAIQKNHKEAMEAIAALNEAISKNSRNVEELGKKLDVLIQKGVEVSGQMYAHTTVHVREGPSVKFKSIGYLKGGEVVKIDRIERKWVRIKEGPASAEAGKWQGKWCTMLYMQLSVEPIVEPQ